MSKKSPTPGEALTLATAKLASSGLTWAQGQSLQVAALDPIATRALAPHCDALPSLFIPYFDPRVADATPLRCQGRPPFWRLRYLASPPAAFGEAGKPHRYTQSTDTGVCAYFPRLGDTPWPALLTDVGQPLIVTEGELKAASAMGQGFPAIGLGGVFNFASKDLDVSFLEELEAVTWRARCVYVVYDSDLRTNSDVCLAFNRLARQLQQRGAQVYAVFLPPVTEDGKTGLDDFLVAQGADALRELLQTAAPLTGDQVLHQLNQHHVYLYASNLIYNTITGAQQGSRGFDDAYASLAYETRTLAVKKDGPVIERKQVPATKAWMRWPLRREAGRLTYEPSAPPGLVVPESDSRPEATAWNLWPGFAVAPEEGDLGPWTELLNFIFQDEPDARTWFEQWCAYPFQYPGTKLYTACIFYGRLHGTGKSLLGYTLGAIYGENFTTIGNEELHGKFNGWAARRQFVLGDEITGSDRRELTDRVKRIITQQKVRVDEKFEKPYELRDCVNFLFTSNRSNSFIIEDDDRRLFVHEMPAARLDEEDFFKAQYEPWLASRQGKAALLHYLLHEVNTASFNPNGRAPMTRAKREGQYHSRSDLAGWVADLRDDPDGVLGAAFQADLFTNSQLLHVFRAASEGRERVTAIGLGNALREAGFRLAYNGEPFRGPDGLGRYYIIRHPELWATASLAELQAHLKDPLAGRGNVKTVSARRRKY